MRVLDNLARARAGRGGAQGEPSSEPPTRSSQPGGSSRLRETATKILAVKVVEKGAEVARKRRKGELLLSDLDPDFNGDGHVSKEEALIFKLLQEADTDRSGALSVHEVYSVVQRSAKLQRKTEQLRQLVCLLSAIVLVLLLSIGGMMAALLDAYKDTKVRRRCSSEHIRGRHSLPSLPPPAPADSSFLYQSRRVIFCRHQARCSRRGKARSCKCRLQSTPPLPQLT